jgi:hypothetical protein
MNITLSSKPELAFSKEHQTGACRFDALLRAKGALSLSFTWLFLIYLGSYFQCLELIMLVSRTKLMSSGGKGSNLG